MDGKGVATRGRKRKGVPVEIFRRKLSATIVRHRLSVRRGRKMRYEMKRQRGRPPGVRVRQGRLDEGMGASEQGWRKRTEAGALWYTRQRSAHKASNVYNVEKLPGELLRPAWRLPLNFSSFALRPSSAASLSLSTGNPGHPTQRTRESAFFCLPVIYITYRFSTARLGRVKSGIFHTPSSRRAVLEWFLLKRD